MAGPSPRNHRPRHTATLRLSAGRVIDLRLNIRITSTGLLAVGGLVSSILLSTTVLVGVATRHLPHRDHP